MSADRAVKALAATSVAMGACLIAPRAAARAFGLQGDRSAAVVRVIAARDLAIGLGLLGLVPGGRRLWLMAHLLADLLDSALVVRWLRRKEIAPGRGLAWLALATVGSLIAGKSLEGQSLSRRAAR